MGMTLAARPASFASIYLETAFKCADGSFIPGMRGTGFFKTIGEISGLVTNWHVLTGRDPNEPSRTLPGCKSSPTHLIPYLPRRRNGRIAFDPLDEIELYDEGGAPRWFESSLGFDQLDVAFLPGRFPTETLVLTPEFVSVEQSTPLQPGMPVFIIGYPFSFSDGSVFPIWKHATIASEPGYLFSGKPVTLLDSPGRPGMSGSPVYIATDAFMASDVTNAAFSAGPEGFIAKVDIDQLREDMLKRTLNLEFVGIYAGTAGHGGLEQLHLGRMYTASLIDEMKERLVPGSNPVPPVFN